MIANPTNSDEAFNQFKTTAAHAFADGAASYAADVFPFLTQAQEAEFDAKVARLSDLFLDLSDVPPSEYASREAAVSCGLFQALSKPEVGVAVFMITDDLLPPLPRTDLESALAKAGLTPERIAAIAAEFAPEEAEAAPYGTGYSYPQSDSATVQALYYQTGQSFGHDVN